MAKQKFYVVWRGRKPGIYESWEECREQVLGFKDAVYKSFPTKREAEERYKEPIKKTDKASSELQRKAYSSPVWESICVDAACDTTTGLMEYQGLYLKTSKKLFHQGPYRGGTNNIGEFLAIVHALSYCAKHKLTVPIYSDSRTALVWVMNKKAKTKLVKTPGNSILFELLERAEKWLKNNQYPNKILKWETNAWGENPADFGRK
jgi:ribonuclease HI